MRYNILPSALFIMGVSMVVSCKKEMVPAGTASLTIINAVAGSNTLVTNFKGTNDLTWYAFANQLVYSNYLRAENQISSYSGTQNLRIYQMPDTLAAKPFLQVPLDLPVSSINSLFLIGTKDAPDFLLTTDTPPNHTATDSTMGFRFVNLSPGSAPISVNIKGSSYGSEVGSLSYKSITAFKNYKATHDVSSVIFECRDQASGTILGSFTVSDVNNDLSNPATPINQWRFRNFTLALLGVPNGTGTMAQTLLLIGNY